jgi:hypothetical protein
MLGKQMIEQLKLLSEGHITLAQQPDSDDFDRLVVVDGASSALITLRDHDRYSVMFHTLQVSVQHPAPLGLMQCTSRVINNLSYFEQPFALYEYAEDEGIAQIRSNPPVRDSDALWYWEAVLQLGDHASLSLARYHWSPQLPERELSSYPATFDFVGRVVNSLRLVLDD